MRNIHSVGLLLLSVILLAGCQTTAPTVTSTPSSLFEGQELTPFLTNTLTPSVTPTSLDEPTSTPSPTLTATPFTYVVKSDDTMFEIAANFGITTDELKAANPSVNPYLLGAGMTLIIPGHSAEGPTQTLPSATPYPLTAGEPSCTPSLSGGLYCFAQVTNGQEMMVEDVSAVFHLSAPGSGEVTSQEALVPLSRIASGGSLPLFAYFPPPVAQNAVASLEMLTTSSVNQTGTPTSLQAATISVPEPSISISANGLSVMVTGQAILDASAGTAGKIMVAAVAYDEAGQIVGIRRFESTSAVNPGESASFSLNIYSIGGSITKVELFGEANP